MYTMCALWWLCRHKSRYNCGLYLWKLHIIYWANWKCQFLSDNPSEWTSWFGWLAQHELNLLPYKKQNKTKQQHKTCTFCISSSDSFPTPDASWIIFWPSWNPGYIQQKCTSCWDFFFVVLFHSSIVSFLQTGSKSTPKTLLTTLQSSSSVWYKLCNHSGV